MLTLINKRSNKEYLIIDRKISMNSVLLYNSLDELEERTLCKILRGPTGLSQDAGFASSLEGMSGKLVL